MKFIHTIILIIFLTLILSACEKIKYYPDKDYEEVTTLILAHRGGGYSGYQENSIEACEFGLSNLDGIEVDIQLSKDRTIWLAHEATLPECGGISYDCFPEVYDIQIEELDSCKGNSLTFTRLEEIFELMSTTYPGKYISLDVKLFAPCKVTSVDVLGVMNVIADEIIALTNKYNLHNRVMVESEVGSFLNRVKKNSNSIGIYLTSFGDFECAMQHSLEGGLTGISFQYKYDEEITEEYVQLIRKKGLKIQLWTVNDPEYIEEALSINPDFIQTDNIAYFKTLNR
jgi:glycerophosphoryl diester phosphodiesterase